ncbi:spermatogenesis- and oogenesis-specific basic helix-loop-helix-containing protein 1 [Tamandua tetradactyla]|uniref:spermatogenesis- and oogenesis-specific basic helix-loop-helix-containing protein 1 n=1 Tax=Tamandua tetradactyla TaxID=48850 RepID=UPI0040542991
MASRDPEPGHGVSRVPASSGCRGPSLPGPLASGEDLLLAASENQSSCRRRNVLTERERRKRISVSCERLRALLPNFDGRREDMASILEMTVQFLRLAHALVPSEELHEVLGPAEDVGQKRPKKVQQSVLGGPRPVGAPDPAVGVLALTARQDPPSCVSPGEDKGEVPSGLVEVLASRPALPEVSSLPFTPSDPSVSEALMPLARWPALLQWPASPPVSLEAHSWPGHAGASGRGHSSRWCPTEEADGGAAFVPDGRSASGSPMDDGTPFLLTAGPDWWLGSLEGRGGGVPSPALGRSSPLDRPEPAFLAEPEPGFQELQDSFLVQWGPDLGCAGLALREEADGRGPDFLACSL